jgi:hypothetical protein
VSAAWAAVTAGTLAGLITGGFSIWAVERRISHDQDEARRLERRQSYSELLAYAGLFAHLAQALHLTMEFRSGLQEGADILWGARKPLDPLDLHAQMRQELEPIYRAWSAIWTIGTQEAINAANDVVHRAAVLADVATARGEGRSKWLAGLAGEKWTEEQLDAWKVEGRNLALARRSMSEVARKELGSDPAEAFAIPSNNLEHGDE